ncbi:hypothetical protein K443DRAFT_15793 [Laccaria amethystina LaAM-08-1]|uniref:Uncharacterized protein n=1 Tax=Laccaria amethystina LaAM-08-1 TaxID=1095629 RepID=A0A0C9WZF5_9AGAR|nr:hypothetical protein K443DRAFT_15793 [Laccaria amethystina LaAM-08-1]
MLPLFRATPPNDLCVSSTREHIPPCIDLHDGQSVLSQLSDRAKTVDGTDNPRATLPNLGGGNDAAAKQASQVSPGTFQTGGGMNDKNAKGWMLVQGRGKFSLERLQAIVSVVGKERLNTVVGDEVTIASTDMEAQLICSRSTAGLPPLFGPLLTSCFTELGVWAKIPATFAGGAKGTPAKTNHLFALPNAALSALTLEQLLRFAQIVDAVLDKSYLIIGPTLSSSLQHKLEPSISITYLKKLGPEHIKQIFESSRWVFSMDKNLAFKIYIYIGRR